MSRSDGASIPNGHIIVLFGGLGALARRKLLPGLFHLDRAGLMPAGHKIIGDLAPKGGSDDDFQRVALDAIGETDGERLSASRSGCPSARSASTSPNPCGRPCLTGPQKMHELIAPRRWWLPED